MPIKYITFIMHCYKYNLGINPVCLQELLPEFCLKVFRLEILQFFKQVSVFTPSFTFETDFFVVVVVQHYIFILFKADLSLNSFRILLLLLLYYQLMEHIVVLSCLH